jgi:two-component system chemotaxis sensor kinase CheA
MGEDPYKYFRIEARELSEQLQRELLELEKGAERAQDKERIAKLFRYAHTLKGAARVVKQREIAEIAHALEDSLSGYRDGTRPIAPAVIGDLLALVDRVARLVDVLAPAVEVAVSAPRESVSHAPNMQLVPATAPPATTPPTPPAQRTVRADLAEMDALLEGVSEAHAQLRAIQRGLEAVEHARGLSDQLCEQLATRQRDTRASIGQLIASLSRSNAVAEELRSALSGVGRAMTSAVDQVARELEQVRQAAQSLRLQSASELFTAVERTARDAAQLLGRRVHVETRGGAVRLEADALSVLQSALVQLARNAVAHGIEPEAARLAAGKPAIGTIRFEIVRRGDRVVCSCRDDGGGVDLEAVRRAAQRGGLSSAATRALGREELLDMLMRGGLSTSGQVTQVSGRGIGLDVVREAAERLGGAVHIGTEPGRGTWIELSVPMSLASFDALRVEASGIAAVIPLDAVRRTLRVASIEIAQGAEGQRLSFEGRSIPFLPLAHALASGAGNAMRAQLQSQPERSATAAWTSIVIEANGACAAFGTDRVLGTSQAMLRPLGRHAPASPIVAGASLDAEGAPQLVLDPDGLVALALLPRRAAAAVAKAGEPILVIDDSLTTRMLEQSILESAGYEVDVASSAEEGLEKAAVRRYALFLVDVEMPGIDGFTFVERTRADPTLGQTPAILVTSRDAPEDRARGRQVGASAYVVKSEFDQVALLATIRTLVRS